MKRKRILIFGAGVLCLMAAWRVGAYAQTLGGTMAAVGAGAALDAGASGLRSPSQYAGKATDAMNRAGQGAGDEGATTAGGGGGGTGAAPAATTTTVSVSTSNKALNWGTGSGDQMVQELTRARPASRKATASSSRISRRLARMTKAQRSRLINSKYIKPPVGYLAWYLKEDRYKVTSKVWQFVSTPNDRYYYRPWAPAMKLRSPARVIGFHTWQDAMIAGYRPDPVSKPEPGPQLAYLASLTRGPMLSSYFEYVYAGQITPATFDANFRYVRYVANAVGSRSDTRSQVGQTVEQVLGAALGQGSVPTSVSGAFQPRVMASNDSPAGPAPVAISGAAPADAQPGGADKREEDFNKFGSRAGALARKPGQ